MSGPDPSQPGGEFPRFDPSAPVDYPADYPGPPGYPPLPPPVYPGGYPGPGYDPYAPYNPYSPYGPGVPVGTNGKAIASMVCAITGMVLCVCFLPSLAAIVLGLMAMSETRRTGQAGHPLAVAGLALGVLTLVLGMFFLVIGAVSS